jgi:hypothetical protein
MRSNDIIAAAEQTIGTPWVHEGRHPKLGLDCIGVVLHTCRATGFSDYEPPPYPRHAQWYQFEKEFARFLIRVPNALARPSDILVFRQEIFPCHCGVMSNPRRTGEPQFIHGYIPRGRVVEEIYTDEWKRKTRAVFRFPGLED